VKTNDLGKRWKIFEKLPFPPSCAGKEFDGVCLATVDTFAAGCISYFIDTGHLDAQRKKALDSCAADLAKALPSLQGEAKEYFTELACLVDTILSRQRNHERNNALHGITRARRPRNP
jgi:hypothetical protein